MWNTTEEVQFSFYEAKDFFGWGENLQVAESVGVADSAATEVAEETGAGDEDVDQEDED